MHSGFVDIHHHLLDGMDDGPSNFEGTVRMLRRAAEEGVCRIAATPHMTPGMVDFNLDKYLEKLEKAQEYVQQEGLPLTLCQGTEVYYTSFTPNYLRQGRILTLGSSWHVLVEFHPHERYENICNAAVNVCNAGYSMVLAHAERYHALRRGDRLAELQEQFDIKVQMNSSAILKAHQGWGDRWIRKMLRDGVTDIISSDAHNTTTRLCTMKQCAALINSTYGEAAAKRLLSDTALAILHEKDSATTILK